MSHQPVAETATGTTHNIKRKKNIHIIRGIRTHEPNNRAAADVKVSIARPLGTTGNKLERLN
jgi:hypothetical protein